MAEAHKFQAEASPLDVNAVNAVHEQRWQVLHPGQPLPQAYVLQPGATKLDYDRIDKNLTATETAEGTKAQRDATNALRQQGLQLAQIARGDTRADRSYQYNNNQLDALQAPIEGLNARMSRLQASLDQNTPQADALVAPELLTVMAGGQGAGLRMNEAEIARIVVGGRSNWQGLQAAANKWSLDPSTANSITPSQRQQIRALVAQVQKRVSAQSAIINDARDQLNNTDDPAAHRQIVAGVRRKLSNISGAQTGGGGQITVTAPDGSTHVFPDKASANRFKQLAGIQ